MTRVRPNLLRADAEALLDAWYGSKTDDWKAAERAMLAIEDAVMKPAVVMGGSPKPGVLNPASPIKPDPHEALLERCQALEAGCGELRDWARAEAGDYTRNSGPQRSLNEVVNRLTALLKPTSGQLEEETK